ncbi:MAG: discoidin domain-containing protein, partial [Planctomycetota bacterium]
MPRDVILGWETGAFAASHDVYFGTVFDDVNDADTTNPRGVLASRGQLPTSYTPPQRLNFVTTYYWRIDEVNAPPSNMVHKGDIWSFMTEPFSYQVQNIIATASSSAADKGPENTVNDSGLDSSGLHGNVGGGTMWLSDAAGPQPTWIMFEFDTVHKLDEMLVWNSNESLESVIGLGFKEVTVEYSADGVDFMALGATHEFAQGPGSAGYASNTTIDMAGVAARYVKLTANSNWAGILPQFGLSEVQFFSIPVQ